MPSNSVWLQIIFCSCVKETVLFSFLRSLLHENGRSLLFPSIFIQKTFDWMIKQLLNSVIAKYRDLSASRRSIICLSLRLQQIIDLLATDKSRYSAQPRPIIFTYSAYLSLSPQSSINLGILRFDSTSFELFYLQTWQRILCLFLFTKYIQLDGL